MSCGDDCSKWPCPFCTYLNFNSASRCTMCSTKRVQQHILSTGGDDSHEAFSNVTELHAQDKWACGQCTYNNYPRSLRCVQCYFPRDTVVTSEPFITASCVSANCTSPLQSQANTSFSSETTSATICTQPLPNDAINHQNSSVSPSSSLSRNQMSPTHKTRALIFKSRQSPPLGKSRQSPPQKCKQVSPVKQFSPKGRISPPRQMIAKALTRVQGSSRNVSISPNKGVATENKTPPQSPANDVTQQQYETNLLQKWCCSVCTYENWPKTVRCTMCETPKGFIVTDNFPSSLLPNESVDVTVNSNITRNSFKIASTSDINKQVKMSPDSENLQSSLVTNSVQSSPSTKCVCISSTFNSTSDNIVVDESCANLNLINKCHSTSHSSAEFSREPSAAKCSISQESDDLSSKCGLSPESSSENKACSSAQLNTSVSQHITKSSILVRNSPVKAGSSSVNDKCTVNQQTIIEKFQEPGACMQSAEKGSACYIDGTGISGQAYDNEGAVAVNNFDTERLLRQLRRRLRDIDWAFLNACIAVVEGNYEPVELYLAIGGDPTRSLTTADVKLLGRPSAFSEGLTIIHLAIRFRREDLLDAILKNMKSCAGGSRGVKRVPCYVAPELANDIRRNIAAGLRQRRDTFPCYYVTEFVTYSLPSEVELLGSSNVRDRLWDELLDRDAQKQLEDDAPIINWSLELTERLNSRLYALWNRTAGDCLLDSVLQATWGVFDRDNCLRHSLAASLTESAHLLYPRWKEYERLQATLLDYAVPEKLVLEEWAELVSLASQPGAALDQLHIFVLAHILRRPIIVYGVKNVKSFRGEDLGYARFEGVYLPLLWDFNFCIKSPIALGYTRGHFCALVPICPQPIDPPAAGAILDPGESQVVFLPLMTHDGKLLPVHFITQAEIGCEAALMREWLDVCQSDSGLLVAQQKLHKKPLSVAQMTEEWLNYYRTLVQMEGAPFSRPIISQGYSSDGDSEEE